MPGKPWEHNYFGSPEDLNAAGAVIAAWNSCEFALHQLLFRVLKVDWKLMARIFNLLGNEAREELLRLHSREVLCSEELEAVETFLEFQRICRENRNLVAHATYNSNSVEGGVSLSRSSRRDRLTTQSFSISTKEMWEVAQATYDVSQFGSTLAMAIWAGPGRTLFAGERRIPTPIPQAPNKPRRITTENIRHE